MNEEVMDILEYLEDHLERMLDGERKFVEDMLGKMEAFGEEAYVSERQIDWLRKLADKY